MSRLEKLLLPIILLVGIGATLLSRGDANVAVTIAKGVGILLLALMVTGFIARTIVKVRRAKREQAELLAEMEQLAAEIDREEPAPGESA